jgi:peptidoglycan/xylan/chitin deacetylase (PgdA/CDA1 family)
LTVDDGWKSIHTNALPIMQARGLVSTQFLNSEPITGNFAGYMTPQDVKDFVAAGHELGWHTRGHADLTAAATDVATELSIPQDFLNLIGVSAGAFQNFATPFGAYNEPVVTQIRGQYASHRSTDVGFNTKSNFSLNNIIVQNITNTTSAAQVQTWVSQAAAEHSWLVLVYHEVADVTVDPDPQYSATIGNFLAQMEVVKTARDAGTIKVVTEAQAIAEIAPQL